MKLYALLLLAGTFSVPAPKTPPITIHVSRQEFPLANDKAILVRLLIESLKDQGKGKVDLGRELEIRRLMQKVLAAKPLE